MSATEKLAFGLFLAGSIVFFVWVSSWPSASRRWRTRARPRPSVEARRRTASAPGALGWTLAPEWSSRSRR